MLGMKLLAYLGEQTRTFMTVFGIILIALLGGVDYLTGPELSFSIFYLIPISLLAWFVSRRVGVVASSTSAIAWLVADLLAEKAYSSPTIPYWNATVRLGFFLIVTYTLSALRASRDRQQELGHFIVHDLRSPLGNVMTGLRTLQDVVGETLDADQRSIVEMCVVSCDRMLTLINSLLDLARLESGRMPLQLNQVSLRELAEASLTQLALWAGRYQVTLATDIDRDIDMVWTDPTVTMRVLTNLLSNAIKFSQPGSVVTIRAVPFKANMIALSVADQGYGIPKEWVDKVFDIFTQIDTRSKVRGAAGSGLGLTFCRLAVEAQGGQIWLESEPERGTTVTFTLPTQPLAARRKTRSFAFRTRA